MSFNVLVVAEDPTYNGFILDPLVCRMLIECKRPNAKVSVLSNPKISGYAHARQEMPNIVERYSHLDLLLFLPDSDGRDLSQSFRQLEDDATRSGARLICCAAVQEIEAWLLAGHLDKIDASWPEVRSERSVKERFFEPFLRRYGDPRRAGGRRDILMLETLSNYRGLLQRCPELQELEDRIRGLLQPD